MEDDSAGPSATQIRGFCLKRNRDYRKANLVGNKYHRRWVELTRDTLIYAKSHSEVISGNIHVFAVHELIWVRKEGTAKWSMRFPERILTFKVESGSAAERDKWVEALEAAQQLAQQKDESQTAHGQTPLSALQKKAEDSLLVNTTLSNTADGSGNWHISSMGPAPLRLGSLISRNARRTDERGSVGDGPAKPPSPRSLLANARNGAAFVASPRAPVPQTRGSALECAWQRQTAYDSSDDEEQTAANGQQNTDTSCPNGLASSRHVADAGSDGDDSLDETTGSFELLYSTSSPSSPTMQLLRSEGQQNRPESQPQLPPPPPQQQQQQQEGHAGKPLATGASSSISSPRQLTRRITPGIMLIDPSASAISSFSSAAPSSRPSSGSPVAMAKQQGGILKRPSSSVSLPQNNDSSDDDEMLLLVSPKSAAQRASPGQQSALAQQLASRRRQVPLPAMGTGEGAHSHTDDQQPTQVPEDEQLTLDGPGTNGRVNACSKGQEGCAAAHSSGKAGLEGHEAGTNSSRPSSAALAPVPVPVPPSGPPPASSRPAPRPPAGAPSSQRRLRPGGVQKPGLEVPTGEGPAPTAAGRAGRPPARPVPQPVSHATEGTGASRSWVHEDWDADDAECKVDMQAYSGLSGGNKVAAEHGSN